MNAPAPAGKVYLVGAGPGDADLITCKGRAVLAAADSVLYDNLVSAALLALAPQRAERLYVGKKKSAHAFTQEQISDFLIDRARRGLTVVRLKGGDPFIFGRGGEEAEALADAGVPFEVVPGVTTPLGIAAYCGIPLTHRGHTSVVTFVTGHDPALIDRNRVGLAETLVLFMGLTSFHTVAAAILAAGRSPDTPAVAVRWATRPDQQTVEGTLGTLAAKIEEQKMLPPATIVIGGVVSLRGKLNWFERLPLFGKRIVVTRPAGQAASLSARLHALGAGVIEIPTIEILPAENPAALDHAILRLDSYDWLLFTSANGVRFFFDRLDRSPLDVRSIRGRIAAIGPATRAALEAAHLKVEITASEFVAEGLLAALETEEMSGRRVLLARAKVARDTLPAALAARGAAVDVVEAYRTVLPAGAAPRIREVFAASPKPDWITFTSSSTVDNFVKAGGASLLDGVRVASIGPVTTATARKWNIPVAAEASTYDEHGLVAAILANCIIRQ